MKSPAVRFAAPATRLDASAEPPLVSHFEFWPGWFFYLPVILQWIALGIRHGDFSLPTAANPTIETGGLCGESKTAILDQVAPAQRGVLASYVRLPTPDLAEAERGMAALRLSYPVVLKPDIGCNGAGVRLVRDRVQLAASLAGFPAGTALMLQRFAPQPGEAGIFYVRRPGAARGSLTSLTLKFAPTVVGDGRSTVRELILSDARMRLVPDLYLSRLGERADEVPRPGETFQPVFVGNHCKGSVFVDGRDNLTEALATRIEALARSIPEFHFGRFDVRYESLGALRRGVGFTVIEINGVGSEATHVWDARTSLWRAWADELSHFGAAFAIGAANRRRGFRASGLRAMYRAWRRQGALMAGYPPND